MSLLQNCNDLIEKYNINEPDKQIILNLHDELYIHNINSSIIDDTIEEYENICNRIVNYVNINGLQELKNQLKIGFDPFKTNGWISVPDNLFTEEEIKEHNNKREREKFEIIQQCIDDVPSDPE
tara:strand:+ start:68 stop:439 length:372 start_codon:yes stop_codon:yes gene_type:complete